MKKLFVVSDVHSYYNEMKKALDDAGFDSNNKNHIFVSCGDLLDRGPDPVKCLQFVNSLDKDRKWLVLGNHEQLMLDAIYRQYFNFADRHNKTDDTVYKVTGITSPQQTDSPYVDNAALITMESNYLWKEYVNSCELFFETEEYIFVHGYIPVISGIRPEYDPFWRDYSADWSKASWLNGMLMWKLGIQEPNKTIVCGHWHTSYGHSRLDDNGSEFGDDAIFTPYRKEGLIAIDACTAHSGFVNCIELEVEDE